MMVSIDIPPGLNSDDTTFASSPAWVDGSNMRFRNKRAQNIGGFESLILTLLTGVCRSAFPWTDNVNTLNVGFGTHTNLQLYQGGMLYDITPASEFTAGSVDGTGSTGFGTGAYGVGAYGEPSVTDYFPLTWSQDNFGQTGVFNPRNQTLFQWSNDVTAAAVPITNAPAQCIYMLVTPQFEIMALGCSQEADGIFNPKVIRHSDTRGATGWSTDATSSSTSREYPLPGGGRLVAGRVSGQNILAWSDHELWLGTYVGSVTQVWRWDLVGEKCGLIGPGAAVVVGSTAFWISPDRQFYSYTIGGAVQPVACPIREDFADNLADSQGDKIIASSISEFSEIRFDYPDSRDGNENSRYVALCVEGDDVGSWYRGIMARTSMVDAGPSSFPIGTTLTGQIYWHEKGDTDNGVSSDGAPFPWLIESADVYLDENLTMLARSVWPDIAGQIGPISLTVITKLYPQDPNPITWGPFVLQPNQSQVNFKIKGRLFRMRLTGNSTPTNARIGRMTFDAKQCGRR